MQEPLPKDILDLILLEGPLDWLFVNKHFHDLAFKRLLTDARVDPSINDNHALKNAAAQGHYEVVKLLSTDSRVNCSEALYYACEKGYAEIAKLLLPLSELDEEEITGIVENAAQDNKADIMALLMADKHWDPEVYGKTALEVAVCNNAYDTIEVLLTDSDIETDEALYEACEKQDAVLIKLLLAAPQCRLSDELWHSVAGNIAIAKLLLQDPRIDPFVTGSANLLAGAAEKGDLELVELILANKHFDPKKEHCQQIVHEAITVAKRKQNDDIVQALSQYSQSAGSSSTPAKEYKCTIC